MPSQNLHRFPKNMIFEPPRAYPGPAQIPRYGVWGDLFLLLKSPIGSLAYASGSLLGGRTYHLSVGCTMLQSVAFKL